jgi:hypothetical protein
LTTICGAGRSETNGLAACALGLDSSCFTALTCTAGFAVLVDLFEVVFVCETAFFTGVDFFITPLDLAVTFEATFGFFDVDFVLPLDFTGILHILT